MLELYVVHFFSDLQAATPAAVTQNDVVDDEDDEPLNENDDDDDLDDVDQGEDLNTQHLVLAQFDKVMLYLLVLLKMFCIDLYVIKKENIVSDIL